MLINVHKPNDSTYLIRPSHPSPMVDHIGKAIYNVAFNPLDGSVVLNKVKSEFKLPAKIYGDSIKQNADVIWSAYRRKAKEDCVGAIMIGEPGTGKSLTAEILCNKALIADMPVFVFGESVPVEVLYMLATITPAAVFYFDEFSRLGFTKHEYRPGPDRDFRGRAPADLLSFFSDSSLKGHIFILTDNDLSNYPPAFINRPGRFLFRIDYEPLTACDFQQLLNELEMPKSLHETLLYNHMATPYTYDILLRVHEEVSRLSDASAQLHMLRIMNVPRKQTGELVVTIFNCGNWIEIAPKANKVSDTEVKVAYTTPEGESKHITLNAITRPEVEISDGGCIEKLMVAWQAGAKPAKVGDELLLVDSNGPRPFNNQNQRTYY